MRKTLVQTLLAAFCAILATAPLGGGGVMLINMRNAMLAGGKLSAKSYVQDGLVAMWDGIENAEWGVHDATIIDWPSLIGNYVAKRNSTANISWGDNCAMFPGQVGSYFNTQTRFGNPQSYTVECVFTVNGFPGAFCSPFSDCEGGGIGWQYTGYRNISFYWGKPPSGFYNGNFDGTNRVVPIFGEALSLSATASEISATLSYFKDGAPTFQQEYTGTRWNNLTFLIGVDAGDTGSASFDGYIHSIRFYSRALPADEIAANYAVDKARFNLPDAT